MEKRVRDLRQRNITCAISSTSRKTIRDFSSFVILPPTIDRDTTVESKHLSASFIDVHFPINVLILVVFCDLHVLIT